MQNQKKMQKHKCNNNTLIFKINQKNKENQKENKEKKK